MKREVFLYGVNGVVATAVHFATLSLALEVIDRQSAGLANFLASITGITASFFGNRYFVFPKTDQGILAQALKFSGLYGAIAVLHGLTLFLWTDIFALDYRAGFCIAVVIQFSLGYLGNRHLVFKQVKTQG